MINYPYYVKSPVSKRVLCGQTKKSLKQPLKKKIVERQIGTDNTGIDCMQMYKDSIRIARVC